MRALEGRIGVGRSHERGEAAALLALTAFTLLSVAGYWNFALHPERLPDSPSAARFYAISFQFFAQIHILVAAGTLGVVLVRRSGLRWVGAFAVVYLLSFFAEHMGTGYGIPFGGYAYTGLLGPKLGGRVPMLIPVSWFLMALPAWVMAGAALPGRERRGRRLLLGAAWMVAWDLALDPAMSWLTPYWSWERAGLYYGMPFVNLLGWGVTAFALMVALDLLGPRAGLDRLPLEWMRRYYGVVLLLPVGMVAAAGLWPAVFATMLAVASLGSVGRWSVTPRSPSPADTMQDARAVTVAEVR